MPTEYGCLFCITGLERNVVTYLGQKKIQAISPFKLRYRRHRGVANLESVTLFPGYVFFTADSEGLDPQILRSHSDVIKVLYSGNDTRWALIRSDRVFAEELFAVDGEIGLSSAYYVGDRIHIEDGFLKKYEGEIIAVNRRAKTAHIKVTISDKVFSLWLGFEEIEKTE